MTILGWARKPAVQVQSKPPVDAAPAPLPDDGALDALARIVRAFGQHAFDLERENAIAFGEQCADWARHLLTLSPPPTGTAEAGSDGSAANTATCSNRNWTGVIRFFVARRQGEQLYVNTALRDLRQAIWTFAQSLGMALVEDRQTDTRLASQIDRLRHALEALSPEELKYEVTLAASSLADLLSERQRMQRERLQRLNAQVSDLTGQLQEAREESARDPLTQLINRKGFDEFLSRMVFMRDVFAETACLLMIDVDHFKVVNDTYGHRSGDDVLQAIADCLARNFPRKSDMVARYGGEEFAIVLPDTSIKDAARLADRVLGTIRALRIPRPGGEITTTVSIGLGQLGRSEAIQDWLDRTDRALYRAKADGRDRVVEAAL